MLNVFLIFTSLISFQLLAGDTDPICNKYVQDKKFIQKDTTYWETRVLPEFKSVINSPEFMTDALLNLFYKSVYAGMKLTEDDIRTRNRERILVDAGKARFENALTTRAYCSKDFIEKKLPEAWNKFIDCLNPKNRPFCGQDFQTSEKIQKNLNELLYFNAQIGKIIDSCNKNDLKSAYLQDIQEAYKHLSERIKFAMSQAKMAIEEAKAQELKKIRQEYDDGRKKIAELNNGEKVMGLCKDYLKQAGYDDTKNILPQIASCENVTNKSETKNFIADMKKIEKKLEDENKRKTLDLDRDLYNRAKEQTGKAFLIGYYRVHGELPNEAYFQTQTMEPMSGSSAYQWVKENLNSIPRMNVIEEMNNFNKQVENVNAACQEAMKLKGENKTTNKVNLAYQNLLYKSELGKLMKIGEFADKVGKFNQKNCLKTGEGLKLLQATDRDKVVQALDVALNAIALKGRDLYDHQLKLTDPDDPYKGLRYHLQYNPLILRDLLRDQLDPDKASLLCFELKRMYQLENRDNKIEFGFAIAAAVLSFTPLAPIGVAVSAVLTEEALDQSQVAQDRYLQADQTETVDRSMAQALIDQYKLQSKVEVITIPLMFVPGATKAVAKEVKLAIPETARIAMSKALKGGVVAGLGKMGKLSPGATEFFTKALSKVPTLGELQIALARSVGPKASTTVLNLFNKIGTEMVPDAAMMFATLALAMPDPPGAWSEEGLVTLLKAVAMSQSFKALGESAGKFLASKGVKVVVGAKDYVVDVKNGVQQDGVKGLGRLIIENRTPTEKGLLRRFFSAETLQRPFASTFNTKKQLNFVGSLLAWEGVNRVTNHFKDSSVKTSEENAEMTKASLAGGDFVWGMMEQGLIDKSAVPGIFDEHDNNFQNWLDGKLVSLPRLDDLSSTLNLSAKEKADINSYAKKLYINELNHLKDSKAGTKITNEEKVKFHESIVNKLASFLDSQPSLKRLSPELKNLLSTMYYPDVPIGNSTEVKLTAYIYNNQEKDSKEIVAALKDGLPMSQAIFLAYQQINTPELAQAKMNEAKKSLPPELQHVANRPDLPFLPSEIEMKTKPGVASQKLSGELALWKLMASDPRFESLKDAFKEKQMGEVVVMQYLTETAIPAYNQIYDLIEKKNKEGLSSELAETLLKNPFFDAMKEKVADWQKNHPGDSSIEERKQKSAELWLDYHQKLAEGQNPDLESYSQKYEKIFE